MKSETCEHGFKEPNCRTCDPHGHCTDLCNECHGNTRKSSKRKRSHADAVLAAGGVPEFGFVEDLRK